MSKESKYTNEPLGTLRTIPDFLPPPNELAFKEDTVKVTIALSRFSVEFFKQEAEKHGTKYQQMIRRLLDIYAQSQQHSVHDRHAGEKVTRKTPQKR